MKHCGKCGAPLREGKSFCPQCGAEVRHPEPVAEPIAEPIPEPVAAPVAEQPSAPAAVKERRPRRGLRRLVTALIVLVLLGGLGAAGWYWGLPYIESLRPAGELPAVSYSYMSREPEIEIDYEAVDSIYPSLYNTTDYILLVRATSEGGERDVMIRAEVPGFTQVYEQKFTLGSQLTQFYIHPPVLTGELSLGSAKQAQIVFSVTDIDSGKPVIQDTLPIQIMSKFDMINYDPVLGVSSWDYYLSFLTPESPGVLELKRNAVDFITGRPRAGGGGGLAQHGRVLPHRDDHPARGRRKRGQHSDLQDPAGVAGLHTERLRGRQRRLLCAQLRPRNGAGAAAADELRR